MITTVIADDEDHARERLRDLLARFGRFDIVAEARDGNEALQQIIAHKPEVVFSDINMPGMSVFQSIPSLQNPPLIIFQTAYSEHAANAYDINALDYLLKPLRFERLEKTVAKIIDKLEGVPARKISGSDVSIKPVEQVTVTIGTKTKIIATEDIVRISLENGMCYIHTVNEKAVSDKYLNFFEEKLAGGRFFKTSRTDIVKVSHIAVIHREDQGEYIIEMKNGARVDLSRRQAQQLRKIMDF